MGQITLTFKSGGTVEVDVKKIEINSSIEEDKEMKAIIGQFTGEHHYKLYKD